MKILILENDWYDKQRLNNLLVGLRNFLDFELEVTYFRCEKDLFTADNLKEYELGIIDVYLSNEEDGIDIADKLQKINPHMLIAFITSSKTDMLRAIRTHCCFDYIVKSDLDSDRLLDLINESKQHFDESVRTVTIKQGKRDITLRPSRVVSIESRNKQVLITLLNGNEYLFRSTFSNMKELFKQFDYFLNCNRGILINLFHVEKLHDESFEMKNGKFFPIRQRGLNQINNAFKEFQFKQIETINIDKQENRQSN